MIKGKHTKQILNLLREAEGSFVSGSSLSAVLGITRTAVWKQMGLLRRDGYQIEAVTAHGYKLVAEPEHPWLERLVKDLAGQQIGCHIEHHQTIGSTNVRLRELAGSGAGHGTLVIADEQTSGRGRLGRNWLSPAGVNLYTSILLRPHIPPYQAPLITFVASLAVARTLEKFKIQPTVKWPNDLLIDNKKVSGILLEMSADMDTVNHIVLGIGINLNMRSTDLEKADLRYPATSVAAVLGEDVDRYCFACDLFVFLEEEYERYLQEGICGILADWEARCSIFGKQVSVDAGSLSCTGTATGLGDDGALLIRLADGEEKQILAGDVRLL